MKEEGNLHYLDDIVYTHTTPQKQSQQVEQRQTDRQCGNRRNSFIDAGRGSQEEKQKVVVVCWNTHAFTTDIGGESGASADTDLRLTDG